MIKNNKLLIAAAALVTVVCFITLFVELYTGIVFGMKPLVIAAVIQTTVFALFSVLFCKNAGRQKNEPEAPQSLNQQNGECPDSLHIEEKFNSFISIIENLESNEPFKNILQFIYDSFSPYIPYTHIGVALVTDNAETIRAAYAVSGPQHPNLARRISGYKTPIRRTSLLRLLQTGNPRVINDLEEYLHGREIHEYNRILLEEGIKSSITFPLVKNGTPIGIIFFSSNQKNIYRTEHIDFLKKLAESIMLSLDKKLLLDEMVVSSTLALATLAEERDNETGMHLVRMKKYTTHLAELLSRNGTFAEVDTDFIGSLETFSPLHDIGKVAISDSILLKPARLTPAEFSIMKTHTTYGGKVLRMADENVKKQGYSIFGMGIEITEGHHEHWNGGGYPFERSSDSIPLSARIVAVADVFDALTSKRPYKEPFSFEQSAKMIIGEAGSHFDPRIVDVFTNNLSSFKSIYNGFRDTF